MVTTTTQAQHSVALPSADIAHNKLQITAPDGHSLMVRRWAPLDGDASAELLVLHGYMEHGGRYRELAHRLASHKIATTAVDFRGHGRSDGPRGYVERFEHYHDDAQAAFALLSDGPRFILGHSNGGLIALDFVVTRSPKIAGLIVTNPYLGLVATPHLVKRKVAEWAGRLRPQLSLPAGLNAAGISHDPGIVSAYKRDPLVFTTANASWFREVAIAQERVMGYQEVPFPLMYIYSDADPVASPTLNRALAAQLRSTDKTVKECAGEYHEVLNEVGRQALHKQIANWIIDRAGGAKQAMPER